MKPMEPIYKEIFDSILNGEQEVTKAKVQEALDQKKDPGSILNEAMVAGMAEVGRLFEEGEYFVPEMLIAARAMQGGLAVLKPHLVDSNIKPIGKVVMGTVKGDLHDIGKNLVGMMLEGAAFEIIDLGSDVNPEKFVEGIRSSGANIVCMSALLTTTMPNMKVTIDAIKAANLRDKVKIMVGGAPLTDKYASEIGADGFAPDANRAVNVAKRLVGALN
jgi:5-methyltetrahydrofolate--homocysteine methyltransferase